MISSTVRVGRGGGGEDNPYVDSRSMVVSGTRDLRPL